MIGVHDILCKFNFAWTQAKSSYSVESRPNTDSLVARHWTAAMYSALTLSDRVLHSIRCAISLQVVELKEDETAAAANMCGSAQAAKNARGSIIMAVGQPALKAKRQIYEKKGAMNTPLFSDFSWKTMDYILFRRCRSHRPQTYSYYSYNSYHSRRGQVHDINPGHHLV